MGFKQGITVILSSKNFESVIQKKELPIMKLVQITNSTYNEVNRNLRILEGLEIIMQQHIGNKRIIRLNFENEKTLFLLRGIEFFGGS